MAKSQYILPPDSLNMVVYAFIGIGLLLTAIAVVLAYLQNRTVCKPPSKADLSKLSSIEQLQLVCDDDESEEQATAKKADKKDV